MHHLNISLVSLIFLASGSTGLVISVRALPRYHFSLHATNDIKPESDRRDAAFVNRGMLAREYVRLSIHILTVGTGIASFFDIPLPIPPNEPPYNIWFTRSLILFLLWVTIATTINTYLQWEEYKVVRYRKVLGYFDSFAAMRRHVRRREAVSSAKIRRDRMAHHGMRKKDESKGDKTA